MDRGGRNLINLSGGAVAWEPAPMRLGSCVTVEPAVEAWLK
jgi:hypothetical protein